MAQTNYNTTLGRNLIRAEQEMLRGVEAIEVLGPFGKQMQQPKNKTDTIVFRRLNVFNMAANGTPVIDPNYFRLSEGTNPPTHGHTYTDVSVTLKQFGYVEKFSDKAADMYEDDIPGDARTMTSNVIAEIAELVRYGQIKAGTNVDYSNGTTRVGVNTSLTLNAIRRVVRTLMSARASRVTSKLSSGPNFGTSAVKAGFYGFAHTDMNPDIRDLPGFIAAEEYGSGTVAHPNEIGAVEEVRFITSPIFAPFLAAGAAVGASGMKAANTTTIDVYPLIITAADAWGSVALKGQGAIKPILIPAVPSANTPLGMYGFVGAKFWMESVRLNENFMARIETAVRNLA